MCSIEEKAGQPLFKVKVVEKGHDDLILTGPTPKGKHHQVLSDLQIKEVGPSETEQLLLLDQIVAFFRFRLMVIKFSVWFLF